jgi:hypothetical protein
LIQVEVAEITQAVTNIAKSHVHLPPVSLSTNVGLLFTQRGLHQTNATQFPGRACHVRPAVA